MDYPEDQTLALCFVQLKEFAYAVDELNEMHVRKTAAQGSAKMRFHLNGIYQYLSSWFLLGAGGREFGGVMFEALEGKGFEKELDRIKECLRRPVGSTTIAEVIRNARNKLLTHNVAMSFQRFEEYLAEHVQATPAELEHFTTDLLPDLCLAVRNLYIAVGTHLGAE